MAISYHFARIHLNTRLHQLPNLSQKHPSSVHPIQIMCHANHLSVTNCVPKINNPFFLNFSLSLIRKYRLALLFFEFMRKKKDKASQFHGGEEIGILL